MEDIRRPRSHATRPSGRSEHARVTPPPAARRVAPLPSRVLPTIAPATSGKTVNVSFKLPRFVRSPPWCRLAQSLKSFRVRLALVVIALVLLLTQFVPILEQHLTPRTYALGQGESLLAAKDSFLASKLKLNAKTGEYDYNANFSEVNATSDDESGGPQIKAVANEDPTKGLQVTDPLSDTEFDMTPQFAVLKGKQDGNRVVYPLLDGTGWVVYTMQATGVKEDVVLSHANGDTMKLRYKLDLASQGLAARAQKDGSIGIYGSSSPVSGNVTTGDAKDAALLQKAREHAKKDKLLFSLPKPIIYETGHVVAKSVSAHYELSSDGETVTTVTTGLKKGHYPLDVDPAVTVIGSSDLFRDTNAESNIDLDATTGNISRGKVTGGVVTTNWTANSNNLGTARFLDGATVYDDYAYVAGGAAAGSTSDISTVEYAAISKVDQTIGTWATTTALPVGLSRFQLIAYNGYMYAIGGSTTNTTCAGDSNHIYYNRIQSNGQLSANWTTNTVNLPASLCGLGAAIYNNKLYVAGGRTGSLTSNGATGVYYAGVNPDGSVGGFTTDDSTLPAARYDTDLKIYNGYAYVVGGTLAGTPTGTVLVAPLDTNGSFYGGAGSATWDTTAAMVTARTGMGGTLSAVNDGYVYVEGGCKTLNANQSCTALQSDVEVAQINADGTLGSWSNIATTIASYSQVGGNLIFWRGTIYVFAGCSAMSTTAAQCTTALNAQKYDSIASPAEIGPSHPGTTMLLGVYDFGSVVVNGYIYVIGGCESDTCQASSGTNTSDHTYYALIGSDGSLGAWSTDTHTLNGTTGLAAFGIATANGNIYLTGGYARGTGAVSSTWFATTNASGGGITANWTNTGMGALGVAKYSMSTLVYHGYVYTFGGCSAASTTTFGCSSGDYTSNTYSGQMNALTGKIATWTARTSMPTAQAASGGAIYNGYVYLAGGASDANAQTTTILYAKLNTDGTIANWLGPAGTTANAAQGTNGNMPNPLRRTNAYAMNGYLYVIGGHNAAGNGGAGQTYGNINIGKINMATGNIDNDLTASVVSVTPRWDEQTVFSNGRMYVEGGCDIGNPPTSCTDESTSVEYVEIYNAGNKGTSTWSNSTNVPGTSVTDAAATAYNGYIYVVGGCNSYTVASNICAAAGNYQNTVYYAPLNPDGSVGSWTAGATLPQALEDTCMVAVGGYIYTLGGEDTTGAPTSTVYYSQINSSTGASGSWSTSTHGIVSARKAGGCAVFNGHIYYTGGYNSTPATTSVLYYSPDMSAGGNISSAWSSGTAFSVNRAQHMTVVAGGYLYVMGGISNAGAYLGDVQFIQLNPSTGSPTGSWGVGMDLPDDVAWSTAFAANGYIYLQGGRTASTTCSAVTYIAAVNGTGSTSAWSQSATNFTTPRFGASGAFYDGYYYVIGGDDCANVISSNQVQYGGEQSQAMKGIFSKYADLNGDGNPQKLVIYLTNAVLNSVDIEKWQLNYVSSREAANSWGASTTISPLIDENAYDVSALNGSGTDQVVARWFYLSFSIDMTTSFTFTDDTQPTVNQYGLHYSPPPSKRLIHGQDFRDQTHQGLDLNL